MGTSDYGDEFKRDAVHQITVRGYPVREVSRRLGASKYSLYKWVELFGEPSPKPGVDHEAENRRLKRELARVTEERAPDQGPLRPAVAARSQDRSGASRRPLLRQSCWCRLRRSAHCAPILRCPGVSAGRSVP
jgi:transposase